MKISIVILNWNGLKYVIDCVQSIKNQTYKDYELIIVDNNSTDGSIEKLQERFGYDNIIYDIKDKNYGFAKGMNIGVSKCKGEIVVLLNNDVYLKENFLQNVVDKFDEKPFYSTLRGKELAWDKGEFTNAVQSGALYLKHRVQCVGEKTEQECECVGPHGSFVVMKKSLIDDIVNKSGYLYDEDFETGWEDTDLWIRMQLFGHRCLYIPKIIAWHVGSASANENKRLIDKDLAYQTRIFRNRFMVIKKNYTKEMLRHEFFYLYLANSLLIPYYLLKSPKSLKALFKGYKLYRAKLKDVKEKRDRIRQNVIVKYKDFKTLFRGF